jgi:hypothetical protein
MLKSPSLHTVEADYEEKACLVQKPADIVPSAAVLLEKRQLVEYESVYTVGNVMHLIILTPCASIHSKT